MYRASALVTACFANADGTSTVKTVMVLSDLFTAHSGMLFPNMRKRGLRKIEERLCSLYNDVLLPRRITVSPYVSVWGHHIHCDTVRVHVNAWVPDDLYWSQEIEQNSLSCSPNIRVYRH